MSLQFIRKTLAGNEYWDNERKKVIIKNEKQKSTKMTKTKSKTNDSK